MKIKIKIKRKVEVDVKQVVINVAVRYDEEDIPNNFPLRTGDVWIGTVDVDTGKILEWPVGKSGKLAMKVCDEGIYTLIDADGKEIAKIENDYVPNGLIPGEFGDYIDLDIDKNGIITNWPKKPDFSEFFGDKD